MTTITKHTDSTKIANKRLERTIEHHRKYFSNWKSSRFDKNTNSIEKKNKVKK